MRPGRRRRHSGDANVSRKLQPASGPTAHLSCKHVGAWAVGGWLQRCTLLTAVHHSALCRQQVDCSVRSTCQYMILHGRRLIQATQSIIQPKQIARDCSANTADWLNCQYRRPRYYIVQYRYQYRPHLRRYPGIRYTGIPVLEALITYCTEELYRKYRTLPIQYCIISGFYCSCINMCTTDPSYLLLDILMKIN